MMRIGEAAKMLGVSAQTLRNYVSEGRIECSYTPSGQRIFSEQQLSLLQNDAIMKKDDRAIAFYARSSKGNENEIQSQINKMTKLFGEEALIFTDKGSGLNEDRKGLERLIKSIKNNEVKQVTITNKDRLTRFGFKYLKELFDCYGTKIIVLDDKENNGTIYDELMRDFMSLIASFAGKFYRIRGYEQRNKLLDNAKTNINEEINESHCTK